MVGRDVNVETPDMKLSRMVNQEFRHPSADDHELVAVVSEKMNELDQNGARRRYSVLAIVRSLYHEGLSV
jgi:hypothetical protein